MKDKKGEFSINEDSLIGKIDIISIALFKFWQVKDMTEVKKGEVRIHFTKIIVRKSFQNSFFDKVKN